MSALWTVAWQNAVGAFMFWSVPAVAVYIQRDAVKEWLALKKLEHRQKLLQLKAELPESEH